MAHFSGRLGTSWTEVVYDDEGNIVGSNFSGVLIPSSATDIILGFTGFGTRADILEDALAGTALEIRNLDILAGASLNGFSSNLTIHGLVENAGNWTLQTDRMTVMGASIENDGTITVLSDDNQNNNSSVLRLAAPEVQLLGDGTLVLGSRSVDGGDNSLSTQLTGTGGALGLTLLENFSTIEGAGTIGFNNNLGDPGGNLVIQNKSGGLIDANVAGVRLHIYSATVTDANPTTNAGTMQASAGGSLYLQAPLVEQTPGGVIRASGAGSQVVLHDGHIRGGHLATDGGGVIRTGNFHTILNGGQTATTNLTLDTNAQVWGVTLLELRNRIVNKGDIVLDGYGGVLGIGADGVTLTGQGEVILSRDLGANLGYHAARIQGIDPDTTALLTNVDNVIHGAGLIGRQSGIEARRMSLINGDNGVIAADDRDGALELRGFETFRNSGVLRAEAGARLVVASGSGDVATGHADELQVLNNLNGDLLAIGAGALVELAGNNADFVIEGGRLTGRRGGEIRLMNETAVLDGGTERGAVTLAGDIRIEGGATFRGEIAVDGTVHFARAAAHRLMIDGAAELVGSGEILLAEADSTNWIGSIRGSEPGEEANLINTSTHIRGAGMIGSMIAGSGATGYFRYGLSLTNGAEGRISADLAGRDLVLEGLTSFRNLGLLDAVEGGTLRLRSALDAGFRDQDWLLNNQGGTVRADGAGSVVRIEGGTATGTVRGGRLETAEGGTIELGIGGRLDGSGATGPVQNAGLLRVAGDAGLRGQIVNSGEIVFDVSGPQRLMIDQRGAVLSGAGHLMMGGGQGQDSLTGAYRDLTDSLPDPARLTNRNTIEGDGFIGSLQGRSGHMLLQIVNDRSGVLRATEGETLVIDTGYLLRNDGVIEARGGTLDLHDRLAGKGRLQVAEGGTLILGRLFEGTVHLTGAGHETVRSRDGWDAAAQLRIVGMSVGDRIELGSVVGFPANADFEGFDFSTRGLFRFDTGTGMRSFAITGLTKTDLQVQTEDGLSQLVRVAVTEGRAGADTMAGGRSDDRLKGLGGNDLFESSTGNDIFDGGAGIDAVTYADLRGPVQVTLGSGATDGLALLPGSAGQDILRSIENVIGGGGDDRITGNQEANRLAGFGGDDRLDGGAGRDQLLGGTGADTLSGGGGADTLLGGLNGDVFLFDLRPSRATQADRVLDFDTGSDRIHLSAAAFRGLGTGSAEGAPLAAVAFKVIGSGDAVDRNDRVIYDSTTGQLFHDANGAAAGQRALIAVLDAGLSLTSADIDVIL